MGYKPILAHPERYNYMDVEQLKRIRMMGCNLQLNTISLTGYYGKPTKALAEELVDNQMIDFISSDMHHPRHAQALEDALKLPYLRKLLFDYPLKNALLK
jgi:protein-tyrosine phosphatase